MFLIISVVEVSKKKKLEIDLWLPRSEREKGTCRGLL